MKKLMMTTIAVLLTTSVFAYENSEIDCSALADSNVRDVKVINSNGSIDSSTSVKTVTE